MFSGIVEGTGQVRDVVEGETTRSFRVEAPEIAPELCVGDSVAVDGACLTVVDLDGDSFSVDVIGTTLARTIAGSYAVACRVNLERALKMGGRVDGHLVQGHVDGIGCLRERIKDGEFWLMDFTLPFEVFSQTIEHGSITLNGVSLTVNAISDDHICQVAVIPFTWEHTNLSSLEPGARVNVEGDLIGKYVRRLLPGVS